MAIFRSKLVAMPSENIVHEAAAPKPRRNRDHMNSMQEYPPVFDI